ncbi:hypothetical protein [Leifsonia aquatica]
MNRITITIAHAGVCVVVEVWSTLVTFTSAIGHVPAGVTIQ